MAGPKLHLFLFIIILISFGIGDGAPRIRKSRKNGGIITAIVGSATRAVVRNVLKTNSTKAPRKFLLKPIPTTHQQDLGVRWSEPTIQTTISRPLAAGMPGSFGSFNNTAVPHGTWQGNQSNLAGPLYAPNNIFYGPPIEPAAPVQYPRVFVPIAIETTSQIPPSPVMSLRPYSGTTVVKHTPAKSSASGTFNLNSPNMGLIAFVTYHIASRYWYNL